MCVFRSALHILLVVVLVSFTTAQNTENAEFRLAPIAAPTPESTSFELTPDKECDTDVVTTIYELYARNTMVFQTCVSEAKYQIFPFSGQHPTPQQIGDMARSLACRAIFTSICLAGIPQCEMSNFPLRAAAETLLKIGVDIDKYPQSQSTTPSTERFRQMMHWRRDVNNARAAGRPCDSQSKLYAEYTSNLYAITANELVRLTADKVVQYRTRTDGSFSQDEIIALPDIPRGGSGSDNSSETAVVYAEEDTAQQSTSTSSSDALSDAPEFDAGSTNGAAKTDSRRTQTALAAIVAICVLV